MELASEVNDESLILSRENFEWLCEIGCIAFSKERGPMVMRKRCIDDCDAVHKALSLLGITQQIRFKPKRQVLDGIYNDVSVKAELDRIHLAAARMLVERRILVEPADDPTGRGFRISRSRFRDACMTEGFTRSMPEMTDWEAQDAERKERRRRLDAARSRVR